MSGDILYRGFHEYKDGKSIIVVNGTECKGDWVTGYLIMAPRHCTSPQAPIDFPVTYITSYNDETKDFQDIEVLPETVGKFSGKDIYCSTKNNNDQVWQNDVIGIYGIDEDDNGDEIRVLKYTVAVKFDSHYQMLFAEPLLGSMWDIRELTLADFESDYDIPFTFWLECLEDAMSINWDWDVIGTVFDKEYQ